MKQPEKDASALYESVYPELRRLAARLMARERPGHTLQATALAHEAYLTLFRSNPLEVRDQAQFYAVAARAMRRILVDHAREQTCERRGSESRIRLGSADTDPHQEAIAVNEALIALERAHPRAAKVVELKYFLGLTDAEVSEILGVSASTTKIDWRFAKAFLFRYLETPTPR
jgi:RNA polymerase sigma factor (TIGR02999 family)